MSKASVSAELVRRERELSGLEVLLDPHLFCALAEARCQDTELSGGRLVRIRYSPGREAVALFAFDAPGGTTHLHARALVPGEAQRRAEDAPPPGVDDEWFTEGVAVRRFPRDEGLPTLAPLLAGDGLPPLLGGDGTTVPNDVRTVRYAPGRWWVGRVEVAGRPVASLKVLEDAAFETAYWNGRALASGDLLRLPRVLGSSRDDRALACSWVHGRTLRAALGDPTLAGVMLEAVGAALAELHAQDAGALTHCTGASETRAIRHLVTTLTHLLPRTGSLVGPIAERITRKLLEMRTGGGPVHGDPSPDRLLLQGDRVALLDVDRACRGEAARDLGALLAHLDAMALEGRLPRAVAERTGGAIMEGYRRLARRQPSDRDVRLYRACALLRLSLHPFRRLDDEWPAAVLERIRRAGEILDAGRATRRTSRRSSSRDAG